MSMKRALALIAAVGLTSLPLTLETEFLVDVLKVLHSLF